MHIIVAGTTGFVGAEVLSMLATHPAVKTVTALTRRPLSSSSSSSPKVKNIVLEDFTSYPPSLLSELSTASAAIWTLGTYSSKDSLEHARKVNLDYTLAAANAFAQQLAPQLQDSRKFNFVYTSGILAERDQSRNLWLRGDFRKMRGEVENQLLALPTKAGNRSHVQTFVTRPGGIRPKHGALSMVSGAILPKTVSIRVEELTAAMIELAINGGEKQIWENAELVDLGRKVLATAPIKVDENH